MRIPNGSVNTCFNCHINPNPDLGIGGARTPFGNAVFNIIVRDRIPIGESQPEPFWGPELAMLDSDGDGFTNGQELQDPTGSWSFGQPDPGNPALVSNPGVASSAPPAPTPSPSPTPADDTFLQGFDFTQASTTDGWIGGALPGGFGGTVSQGAAGICLSVPGPGDNIVLWISPPNTIALIDRTVYRARLTISTDQSAEDAIPLFNFIYQNQQPDFFLNYGGERWIWDASGHGGGNGIGRPQGRTGFEFYFGPLTMDAPQWRESNDAGSTAFSTEADAINDISVTFRVLDVGGGADPLLASIDSGTICVSSMQVSTIPLATLRARGATVYNPPLNDGSNAAGVEDPDAPDRTHFAQSFDNAASFPTVATDIRDGEWIVTLAPVNATGDPNGIGFTRATLGPDAVAAGDFTVPARLFPIEWSGDALYMARAPMRSGVGGPSEGVDPIDLIVMNNQTFTSELGGLDFVTSGADRNGAEPGDGGGMLRAGSPRLLATTGGTAPEFLSFFYGQNVTASVVDNAAVWKAQVDLFKRADLGGGAASGLDPIVVEGLIVDRIEGLSLIGG
jgi:hypothetical protein